MNNDDIFLKTIHTAKHNNSTNYVTLSQMRSIPLLFFVDVGIGDGFYGKLIKYVKPNIYSIGVEKKKSYIKKWNLNNFYDKIINDDIINVIHNLSGDLVVFGDVLEHLEKEDAINVINVSIKNFKYLIINAPVGFQEQNHHIESEIHRCGLNKDDFMNYDVLNYEEFDNNLMFNCFIKGK